MRYRVDGALIESGEAQSLVVEADDQTAAVAQANAQGLMVTSVRLDPSTEPPAEAPKADEAPRSSTVAIGEQAPEPAPTYRRLYLETILLEVIGVLVCMGGLIGIFLAGEESGVFFVVGGLILLVVAELALAFRDHVINGWHIRQAVERRRG